MKKNNDELDKKIEIELKNLFNSIRVLRDLEVLSNKKDFTCQIGEWFATLIFDGEKALSGIQKHWDFKANNKFVQVKSHAKASTTKARFSAIKYESNAEIDELIIIVFSEDYKLKEFYKVPWVFALRNIKHEKHRDVIYWNHLKDFLIRIDDLPKQDVVKLFV